jgi:hypothetical protein
MVGGTADRDRRVKMQRLVNVEGTWARHGPAADRNVVWIGVAADVQRSIRHRQRAELLTAGEIYGPSIDIKFSKCDCRCAEIESSAVNLDGLSFWALEVEMVTLAVSEGSFRIRPLPIAI